RRKEEGPQYHRQLVLRIQGLHGHRRLWRVQDVPRQGAGTGTGPFGRRQQLGELHPGRAQPQAVRFERRHRRGLSIHATGAPRQYFLQAGPHAAFRSSNTAVHGRQGSERHVHAAVPDGIRGPAEGLMIRRQFLSLIPAALCADTEDGFVSLFDGRSLAGWTIREGPQSAFYVKDGAIIVHEGSNFPTWLRSEKQYENFDFRCEFFIKGWMNSGIFLHAPEHGRNTWIGMKINIFHKQDEHLLPESIGAIFPLIPPLKVNVSNKGEWNQMRVLMDWPRLQVWINGEQVQDLDLESNPELRYRLRRGYLGIESLAYPIRFRNLRIKEL